jgi:hypothetical protein
MILLSAWCVPTEKCQSALLAKCGAEYVTIMELFAASLRTQARSALWRFFARHAGARAQARRRSSSLYRRDVSLGAGEGD